MSFLDVDQPLMSEFFNDPWFSSVFLPRAAAASRREALPASGSSARSTRPRLDFTEADKQYHIRVDLPGMKKDEVKTYVQGDVLVIEGERTKAVKELDEKSHIQERSSGFFKRNVELPSDAEMDQIQGCMEDGVLTISIAKKTAGEAGGRKLIPIK